MSWREMSKRQQILEVGTWTPWRRDSGSGRDLERSIGTLIVFMVVTEAHVY